MNRAMPSYSMGDAARTVGEIARDLPGMAARGIGQHYRDQAIGLMTDPIGTASRNVRDTTEMALPVSSLYKMADVATGAEGAEAPDYMDVGMDVANVLGFKGGRELARRAARPALGLAAAGIAMQPDEAEAGMKTRAIKEIAESVRAPRVMPSRLSPEEIARMAAEMPEGSLHKQLATGLVPNQRTQNISVPYTGLTPRASRAA
jgi:hypothetical protein